ncbi:hypothetical protein AB0C51_18200 [Streptomyces pathocidini]|uniref:Transcriptional regulator, AbiEi antitoxin, Type IV TA system n=1 Tax=Streptomyces pathocidini TaxID=1650571 RepID=A0ABW7UU80_9ACTN|nr:hypothetical protein [Streptomyces pathocidini]
MNYNTPLSPRPLAHLSDVQLRVLTLRQLREHGITATDAAERSRPGGCWQRLLPGIFLLHPGPPTSEERLHAALLYAERPVESDGPCGEAMITGLTALALYGFSAAPPLRSLDRVDVLVPHTRRLRSAGLVRIVRSGELPQPLVVTGVPVAPVARALADAAAQLNDATTVRRLLTEAVRDGHCEPGVILRELSRARLLSRAHVVDAVDLLLAEGRALAEGHLYEMVRSFGLPEPVWNVDLRLPAGPHLGGVDAYWPEQAVALEIDARTPRQDESTTWSEGARKREHLERLGITVVHTTPRKLREAMEQQAAVVRTALMAAPDREPAAYVVVLPR